MEPSLSKKTDKHEYIYTGDEPVPIDGDDPQHITWIYEKATERATEFSISGVSYRLTQVRVNVQLWALSRYICFSCYKLSKFCCNYLIFSNIGCH